jgi:hypothetical protein
MSELLWVAVPDGVDSETDEAIIRLLVVPRLRGDRIDVHGLADWPAILRDGVDFKVATKLGDQTAFEQDCRYVHQADSEVWHQFFDGDAGKVGGLPGATAGQVMVDGTYQHAADVEGSYQAVTTALAEQGSAVAGVAREGVVDAELQRWRGRRTDRPPPDPGSHGSRPMDFHRSVSMLRQHPPVLTALGLIVELRVGTGVFDEGDPQAGALIAVRCGNPAFLRRMVRPMWTRYEYAGGDFRPAPTPGRHDGVAQGMLNLKGADLVKPSRGHQAAEAPAWALSVFDVDGAVDALSQTAAQPADPGESSTAPTAFPAIRSVGLSLLRPSRQDDADHRRRRASNRASPAPMVSVTADALTADDLVLGYRVDIRRDDEPWLPLCERDAAYTVNGRSIGPGGAAPRREEGHSAAFAAVKAGNRLHTDQIVVRWTGWSLALPVVKLVDDPSAGKVGRTGPAPYDFAWEYGIPAQRMPALRFGRTYQVRVRVADLAGGGLGVDDVDSSNDKASNSVRYTRYDPVPPPVLVGSGDDSTLGPGAALDRLVIRSGDGLAPETELRRITAPTARLALVEQHGVLPDDLRRSWDIVRRAVENVAGETAPPGLADPAANGVRATIPVEPGGVTAPITDHVEWRGTWPQADAKTIRVRRSGLHGAPIGMTWSLDQQILDVTLAPARQVTIELSSAVTSGLVSHMAVGQWLADGDPLTNTVTGRNPAVSPVRRVVAVHAVRKPLAPPRWALPPDHVVRTEHDTFVTLTPAFELDTHSTGQLDVKADWTDVKDSGPVAAKIETQRTTEHLFSTPVDPGMLPSSVIRQEFGDTTHRSVRYTLNAITRFRRYFEDSEDEALFQWQEPQPGPVIVRSSALPPPPRVLGVLPAFAWQDPQVTANRIEHVRGGRRIRVELARPWFQTGDGERLAVLLDGTQTTIGRDPLFATGTPTALTPDSFRGVGIFTAHSNEIGDVRIVTVDPTPGGDRWYADLEFVFPAGQDTYDPFVRLALARYQPSSLPNLELSAMVVTDTVPVLPDRRVVVDRSGNTVRVTVSGSSPTPANTVSAVLERADAGPTNVELVAGPGSPGGLPSWRQVAAVATTVGGTSAPMTLPAGERLRVRIMESELLQPLSASPIVPAELGMRNVFLDTVALPPSWH